MRMILLDEDRASDTRRAIAGRFSLKANLLTGKVSFLQVMNADGASQPFSRSLDNLTVFCPELDHQPAAGVALAKGLGLDNLGQKQRPQNQVALLGCQAVGLKGEGFIHVRRNKLGN